MGSGHHRSTLDTGLALKDAAFVGTGPQLAGLGSPFGAKDIEMTLAVWELGKSAPVRSWGVPEDVFHVSFSKDGTSVAGALGDGPAVRVWNTQNGQRLTLECGDFHNLGIGPAGRLLATVHASDNGGTVKVWSIAEKQLRQTFSIPEYSGARIAFSGFRVFQVPNGNLVAEDSGGRMAFSGDSRYVAFSCTIGNGGTQVQGWNLETGAGTVFFQTPRVFAAFIPTASLNPTGRLLVFNAPDRAIHLCDTASGRLVMKLRGHQTPVTELAFSPQGSRLATASQDGIVKIWNVSAWTGR